ncbi:MAG: trigger factor [Saprospiraceae bacterium]
MSNINKEELGKGHAKISLEISKADYEPKFKSELAKLRNKAQIKGFRKGKVPTSFLQKMYGNSVLQEVFYDVVGQKLNGYIGEEKLDLIGYPIPAEDQSQIELDPNSLKDYTINYEIGYLPDFELDGVSDKEEMEIYDIEVPEKWVNEEMDRIKKGFGERIEVEDQIMDGDVFVLAAKEVDGDYENEFEVFFNSLTQESKDTFEGKKPGFETQVNVFKLEQGMSEEAVKKYLLELKEDDPREVNELFNVTVKTIKRIKPAELNQETLDKAFGEGVVSTEEEAKAKIKELIGQSYSSSVDSLFFSQGMEYLMEKNSFDVPVDFIKKWLKFDRKKINEDKLDEAASSYANTMRRRTIIKKIIEKQNIKITDEEIREKVKGSIQRALQGQPLGDDFLDNFTDQVMQDEKYRHMVEESADEAVIDKITQELKSTWNLKKLPIDAEAFKAKVEEMNKQYREEAGKLDELGGQEEE